MDQASGNVSVRKGKQGWMSKSPALANGVERTSLPIEELAQTAAKVQGGQAEPIVMADPRAPRPWKGVPMGDEEVQEVVDSAARAVNQGQKWQEGYAIQQGQGGEIPMPTETNWAEWNKDGLQQKQVDFVRKVGPAAQIVATELNVPVGGIISQWALESGWGKSSLAKDSNNYGGFKTGSSWKGKKVNLPTKEKNQTETIKDNFRAYDTVEDFAQDAVSFLNKKRYKPVHGAESAYDYALRLGQAGYHQDTPEDYADKIKGISERLGI